MAVSPQASSPSAKGSEDGTPGGPVSRPPPGTRGLRSAARAEPLHPHRRRPGSPAPPAAGWPPRRRTPSRRRTRSGPCSHSGSSSVAVSRPAGPDAVRLPGEHDQRAGRHQLVGVGQLGQRAGRRRRPAAGPARPSAAGVPQHRDERDDAEAAGDQQRRGRAVPDEPAADRPAHLQLVAGLDDVGEVAATPRRRPAARRTARPAGRRARRRPSTSAARCTRPRRSAGRRSAGRAGGRSGRARPAAARPSAGSAGARRRPSPSASRRVGAPAARPARSPDASRRQSPWYRC